MDISVERSTTAPPDVVWEIATDIERSPDVLTGVDRVERLDDGDGFDVGTRWRETRTLFGQQASEVLEVTRVDVEGRSYRVEADNDGVHYVSDLTVHEQGDGARLVMTFTAQQPRRSGVGGLLAKGRDKAVATATRKALREDLDDIATTAEAATT